MKKPARAAGVDSFAAAMILGAPLGEARELENRLSSISARKRVGSLLPRMQGA